MASLRHDSLVALPSLSCALSSLPQATSLDSVSLHPSMYAQHAADSEAKVRTPPAAPRPQLTPPPAQKSLVQDRIGTPQRGPNASLHAVCTFPPVPPRARPDTPPGIPRRLAQLVTATDDAQIGASPVPAPVPTAHPSQQKPKFQA